MSLNTVKAQLIINAWSAKARAAAALKRKAKATKAAKAKAKGLKKKDAGGGTKAGSNSSSVPGSVRGSKDYSKRGYTSSPASEYIEKQRRLDDVDAWVRGSNAREGKSEAKVLKMARKVLEAGGPTRKEELRGLGYKIVQGDLHPIVKKRRGKLNWQS